MKAPDISCRVVFKTIRLFQKLKSILGSRLRPINWGPSMKVKKLQKYKGKSGLMGCKWSSLNATGTENPLPHSVLKLEEFFFLIIGPLG